MVYIEALFVTIAVMLIIEFRQKQSAGKAVAVENSTIQGGDFNVTVKGSPDCTTIGVSNSTVNAQGGNIDVSTTGGIGVLNSTLDTSDNGSIKISNKDGIAVKDSYLNSGKNGFIELVNSGGVLFENILVQARQIRMRLWN